MYWSLGMFASGSTWVFNVAFQLAPILHPARRPDPRFVKYPHQLGPLDDPALLPIIKSHDTDEALVPPLTRHAEAILISIRDPRDCVASLMLYQRLGFDLALAWTEDSARFCARFVTHPRALLLRYETSFIDDPATLDRIAAHCGGALTPADRERIFAATRRPSIEAQIAQLDTLPTAVRASPHDIFDPATQWHRHHAGRTGEIGRWRHALTPRQVAAIEQRMQDWMASFGYPAEVAPYRLTIGSLTTI